MARLTKTNGSCIDEGMHSTCINPPSCLPFMPNICMLSVFNTSPIMHYQCNNPTHCLRLFITSKFDMIITFNLCGAPFELIVIQSNSRWWKYSWWLRMGSSSVLVAGVCHLSYKTAAQSFKAALYAGLFYCQTDQSNYGLVSKPSSHLCLSLDNYIKDKGMPADCD